MCKLTVLAIAAGQSEHGLPVEAIKIQYSDKVVELRLAADLQRLGCQDLHEVAMPVYEGLVKLDPLLLHDTAHAV